MAICQTSVPKDDGNGFRACGKQTVGSFKFPHKTETGEFCQEHLKAAMTYFADKDVNDLCRADAMPDKV